MTSRNGLVTLSGSLAMAAVLALTHAPWLAARASSPPPKGLHYAADAAADVTARPTDSILARVNVWWPSAAKPSATLSVSGLAPGRRVTIGVGQADSEYELLDEAVANDQGDLTWVRSFEMDDLAEASWVLVVATSEGRRLAVSNPLTVPYPHAPDGSV